jgi:triphosphoribosyl-dephospho-CoA synthase
MIAVADEQQRSDRSLPHDAVTIAAAAFLACVLEARAPKPGNVSPGHRFGDVGYDDFFESAVAIRGPLEGAGTRPLGETILQAVEATSRAVGANTNLGIVLLLTPLVRAAGWLDAKSVRQHGRLKALRATLRRVLADTTVQDARQVFRAIRLANPGGLGRADEQDVATEPTVTLLEAMRLAAYRDGVAREYATAFATTFDVAVPALMKARADRLSWDDAIVETFLTVLAAAPDTHIARRGGMELARRVSVLAHHALRTGGVRTEAGQREVAEMAAKLNDTRNTTNPGTSADLMAAAIFVLLLVCDENWHQEES